jgi:ribosome-associated protein
MMVAPVGAAVVLAGRQRMLGDVVVTPAVVVPAAELLWRFSRSAGPGGQGVNTTDSRVELSLDLATTTALSPVLRERALERLAGRLVGTVLVVVASENRSQLRNREAASRRLAALLREAIAAPAPTRRPTRPSRAARRRRMEDKRRRGDLKRTRRPGAD